MRSLAAVMLAALTMAAASPAKASEAAGASVIAQDPLMRQIRHRMMEPDGGVTTVTWVQGPNGQRLAIPLVDPAAAGASLNGASAQGRGREGALRGLSTDRRLAAASREPAAGPFHGKGRVQAPTRQLRRLDQQRSWQQ